MRNTRIRIPMLDDVLAEAARLRPLWPEMAEVARSEGPTNDGDPPADPPADPPPTDPPADPPANPPTDPPADPPNDGKLEVSQKDWNEMQRQLRESRAAHAKLEKDAKDRADQEAKDKGEFEKLHGEEKERAEKLDSELTAERRTNRGLRIAGRLNSRAPADDLKLLDAEVLDDDTKAETALKDLYKRRPELVQDGEKKTRQGGATGDGGGKDDAEVSGPSRMAKAYGSKT